MRRRWRSDAISVRCAHSRRRWKTAYLRVSVTPCEKSRVRDNDGEAIEEVRSYDKFGRFVEIASFGSSVKYHYDAKGRVSRQIVDGTPIDFTYTKRAQLAGKYFGGRQNPVASLEYEYAKDGRIVARTANGIRQTYEYDRRGQLVAVKENGADVERYAYDKAGNMVRKTVLGKTTTFSFDGANQLVSSTTDGVTTRYEYDAVGRLVREGGKAYRYGYLDKVMSVADGASVYSYGYHVDGQLASADYGGSKSERFTWDGLALVRRGDATMINEPHVGGGNPIVSSAGATYFNDVLGTTVGASRRSRYAANAMTAFGEGGSRHGFFTGKPQVDGLGHAFLFRNYRASLAKWQTADPLGYPDGWNQLAYCGNMAIRVFDICGGMTYDPRGLTADEVAQLAAAMDTWLDAANSSLYGLVGWVSGYSTTLSFLTRYMSSLGDQTLESRTLTGDAAIVTANARAASKIRSGYDSYTDHVQMGGWGDSDFETSLGAVAIQYTVTERTNDAIIVKAVIDDIYDFHATASMTFPLFDYYACGWEGGNIIYDRWMAQLAEAGYAKVFNTHVEWILAIPE